MSNLPDNVTEAMIDAHFGRDDCDRCGGTGLLTYTESYITGDVVEEYECADCDGTGKGPTPQERRELIAEAKADIAHDMERDEPMDTQ